MEAVSTVLIPAHRGWSFPGWGSPLSLFYGTWILPSHQLRFQVPTDSGPAMNTGGHIWKVDPRCLPRLGLGGARQAGPSNNLEEFLKYPLAGDQRPEQAWAGPAGWDSNEPPGFGPHHHFLHPPCCILTGLCSARSSRDAASSQGCQLYTHPTHTVDRGGHLGSQGEPLALCFLPDCACHLLRSFLNPTSDLCQVQEEAWLPSPPFPEMLEWDSVGCHHVL